MQRFMNHDNYIYIYKRKQKKIKMSESSLERAVWLVLEVGVQVKDGKNQLQEQHINNNDLFIDCESVKWDKVISLYIIIIMS